jgi:chaperonin cofactor prefoldin
MKNNNMTNYEKLNEQLSELIIDLQLTKEELKEIEKIFDEEEQ